MARNRSVSLGVDWYLPGAKRPFASTTKATSDLIRYLAADGHTVDEASDLILFDPDATRLLAALSEAGHGGTLVSSLVG